MGRAGPAALEMITFNGMAAARFRRPLHAREVGQGIVQLLPPEISWIANSPPLAAGLPPLFELRPPRLLPSASRKRHSHCETVSARYGAAFNRNANYELALTLNRKLLKLHA